LNEPEDRPGQRDGDRERDVLALNSGSSSLKFGLYRVCSGNATRLLSGEAEGMGHAESVFRAEDAAGHELLHEAGPLAGPRDALERIRQLLHTSGSPAPQVIGHRIVHGGPALRDHCRIDAAVQRRLEAATAFAPLHMSAALSLIREAEAGFPGLPQVACFDTTFHRDMPEIARTLPLPAALREQGIRRYGFHGLSCESIVRQLTAEAGGMPRRLVIAHLGNGASITAVLDGVSVDTSMGLTPSGGVIMGTRSGDLDPGILIYLAREQHFDSERLEDLVDHRSGLLGLSGQSSDMRELHALAASNADVRLAIRMFCQSVRKQVGAMSIVLDGIDLIVFTGGIGEHDDAVRAEICNGLSSIGIGPVVEGTPADTTARGRVRVLPSLEDEQIALHAWALC
jgi:acetate kinase